MRIETIGDVTLYLGDCRKILPTLDAVDMIFTDERIENEQRLANHTRRGGVAAVLEDVA